jgi:branched-chain amino acid transport system permease protein
MGARLPLSARLALVLIAVAVAVSLPFWITQPYLLHVAVVAITYAVPAVGLNLMMGYTGLISIGHMAFAGVGGYLAAVLMVDHGVGFWWCLPLATLAAAALGAAIGATCLHLRSHYFIIVTLATGMILFAVFNNWDAVTRGAEGFPGIPRPPPLEMFGTRVDFRRLPNFYLFALAALLLVLAVQATIVRSDFGRTLAAIRQDETLARFRGVDTTLYKVVIFAIGSGIAGFGGVLKVSFLRVAAPLSFEMAESVNLALIVIAGGAGYQLGPVLGAGLFIAVPEYLRLARQWRLVIFGAALVLMTLLMPRGIAGMIDALVTRLARRRGPGDAP